MEDRPEVRESPAASRHSGSGPDIPAQRAREAADRESRWSRLQRLGRDVAERLRHRAELSRMRARVAQLEARIETEKTRIGRALYPLVEEARITVDLPEVQEGVERIAQLRDEVRRSRQELEVLEGESEA